LQLTLASRGVHTDIQVLRYTNTGNPSTDIFHTSLSLDLGDGKHRTVEPGFRRNSDSVPYVYEDLPFKTAKERYGGQVQCGKYLAQTCDIVATGTKSLFVNP
jgi:hypothetical protein